MWVFSSPKEISRGESFIIVIFPLEENLELGLDFMFSFQGINRFERNFYGLFSKRFIKQYLLMINSS